VEIRSIVTTMRNFAVVGLFLLSGAVAQARAELPWVKVPVGAKGFVLDPTGRPFVPWGVNYDRDWKGRLIEDYWEAEWPAVEAHFAQIKQLGANVVRVHLQFGKFMAGPDKPNEKALDRLGKLLGLAERAGLYLDLTGLGCYHKKDVPAWYDGLTEVARWDAQARFWRAVAGRCADSPAVFCYDLMNEPVVPDRRRPDGNWLPQGFFGKYYTQYVTLDPKGRPRPEISRGWVQHLAAAVRAVDRRHMVTVGLLATDWEHDGVTSGFLPDQVAPDLDFVCVHIYPKAGDGGEALNILKRFAAAGKPVVVEEMFPLRCPPEELDKFVEASKGDAAGWVSFYWGQTPDELRASKRPGDAVQVRWFDLFRERSATIPK
jgi:hypothetical protein